MTTITDNRPALYCGTYGKYNDGSIAGKWLYLDDYSDPEEFWQACKELHKDEHDPEYMFQDYEYLPESLYGESLGTADVEKIYEWLQLEESERELVKEYWDEHDSSTDIDHILEQFEGNINDMKGDNHFMSDDEAYGYYYAEIGGIEIPEEIATYFDYESYGKDILQDMTITESGYIFRNY